MEAPAPAAAPSTDDVAETIASMLTAGGWVLTADSCPVEGCTAPLMRTVAERRHFCPAHKLWVATEAEAGSLPPPPSFS